MGNSASTSSSSSAPLPPTPASSFFNLANVQTRPRLRRNSTQPAVAYPRRSMFAPDEDEPDDFGHEPGVLLGWTRTEHGAVIPQIRSIPIPTPLDDTIFNSPRQPWVEKARSHSPAPSARSIPVMRQFSIDSFRSVVRRELRVINESRPPTALSTECSRTSQIWPEREDEQDDSDSDLFDWEQIRNQPHLPHRYVDEPMYDEQYRSTSSISLKRGNSTNDSGYSSMIPDTASCSSNESEDPWWWEEAAGYSTITEDISKIPIYASPTSDAALQFLHGERQESAYLSGLLRAHPFDEWTEWRTTVTKLLMIPEEEEQQRQERPCTPAPSEENDPPSQSRSPTRRRSLFNFSNIVRKTDFLTKRRSVLW